MPDIGSEMDKGLRRRLVCLALRVKPGDVRQALDCHPVKVTSVLNGEGRLQPAEQARLGRLLTRRAKELFA